jgi:hypothetical protein
MTLTRLLVAALVVSSLPAFTQDRQAQDSSPSTPMCTMRSRTGCIGHDKLIAEIFFGSNSASTATPTEPWKIIPSPPASLDSVQNALDPARLDHYRLDKVEGDPNLRNLRLETLGEDTTCYALRSYVVARDSKDSDSTHPAGYSTCQPSSRYQVKSADVRVVWGDR